jgi:hypothetical protein
MENKEWPAGLGSAIAIHRRSMGFAVASSGSFSACSRLLTVAFASHRMPRGSLAARRTAMFTQDRGRHGIHARNGVTEAA